MAKIGLFIDLDERICDNTKVEKVRQRILARFNIDPTARHRVDIYRMTPLRSHEEIAHSDMLVAHVPQSTLDAPTIEALIQTNKQLESTVQELRVELAHTVKKLTHSDTVRAEALETIEQLRTEFISLADDVNHVNDQNPVSARNTQRSKGVQRQSLGASNSRH